MTQIHRPIEVAIADGTRNATICAECGIVRGGFVQCGEWPCDIALEPQP